MMERSLLNTEDNAGKMLEDKRDCFSGPKTSKSSILIGVFLVIRLWVLTLSFVRRRGCRVTLGLTGGSLLA
jgi:hypothetical protein